MTSLTPIRSFAAVRAPVPYDSRAAASVRFDLTVPLLGTLVLVKSASGIQAAPAPSDHASWTTPIRPLAAHDEIVILAWSRKPPEFAGEMAVSVVQDGQVVGAVVLDPHVPADLPEGLNGAQSTYVVRLRLEHGRLALRLVPRHAIVSIESIVAWLQRP